MPSGIYKRKPCSKETKLKISLANKGKNKGKSPWNKNLKGFRAGKDHHWFGRDVSGEKNPSYKGDDVGYRGLHIWVEKQLGKPRCCEDCGIKTLSHRQYHWANISGNYKRITTDWRRLCVRCHKVYDKQQKLLKLSQEIYQII